MDIAIVTDSNSGIFESEAEELGVFVLPMPVIIDGMTYYEGKNITPEQFYQRLQSGSRVSTSQPSPADVTTLWDKIFHLGYDQILYIPMSSGLSSSCQVAQMLAQEYEGRVCVADCRTISVTQRFSVLDAIALANAGCTLEKIRQEVERAGKESVIYLGVETLEYLKRGGRITPAAAAIGTMMSIKPLLIIKGEKLDAFAKVRGTGNCKKRLVKAIEEAAENYKRQGIDFMAAAAGSFLNVEEEEEWKQLLHNTFPGHMLYEDPLTCSIGCHVGPGAFGMAVYRKLIL